MHVTGVILAGGESRRMGQNKALLPLDGKPILCYVIESLRQVASELLMVTNRPESYRTFGLTMIPDRRPGFGALGGIDTALHHVPEAALIVACDMPFLSTALLQALVEMSAGADAVVPRTERGYEPLCALYQPTCLKPIEILMDNGERRIDRFYDRIELRLIEPAVWRLLDPEGLTFFNVNTPHDYAEAKRLLASRRSSQLDPPPA